VAIPALVRRAAIFPELDLPDPPPEHPYKVVRADGYTIGVFAGLSFGQVSISAVGTDAIERTIEEARSVLATYGMRQGAWMVPEAASPAGLVDELLRLGMVPYEEPPLEPRFAAMVALSPPEPGRPDTEARLTRTFEEYQAGNRVARTAFEVGEDDRLAFEAQERSLWEIQSSGGAFRSFIALIDGEVVGSSGSIDGANATYLSGGSTREDMRGRGVYRALVRARWDAAVERGTPALTVGAGRMSQPILERLGFTTVGWIDCLLDRFE
jgi:GNAT superfamily N-acetyltransferase